MDYINQLTIYKNIAAYSISNRGFLNVIDKLRLFIRDDYLKGILGKYKYYQITFSIICLFNLHLSSINY